MKKYAKEIFLLMVVSVLTPMEFMFFALSWYLPSGVAPCFAILFVVFGATWLVAGFFLVALVWDAIVKYSGSELK